MKSTVKLVAALAMGAAVAGGMSLAPVAPAFAQSGQKPPTVSRAVAKPLKAAQDAMQAQNWKEALARLKDVEAVGNKSPYDTHLMNEMYGFVYVRTRNYAEAARALEAGLNSGFLAESEVPTRVRALAQVNYQIKNYDKAIEFGNRAAKGGYADDDIYTLVGQAYFIKNDFKNTQQFLERYVDSQVKRNQTPKEQTLQLILSSCVKMEDEACQTRTLERLVANHPKPEYWQNLLYSLVQAASRAGDKSLLHVYRLMSEVDVLTRHEDYTEMAQLALEQGSPGEAQRILEQGFAKNVFTEQRIRDRNQRLLDTAKKQAASDRASLAQIEKEAAAAKTGDRDVSVGLAYLSYEQYDKAAELISRGLSKGGVKNEAEARLLLGIAQLESGKRDEAMKNFQTVKGNEQLERLASLWRLHARGTA